jgi:hypothetical protein
LAMEVSPPASLIACTNVMPVVSGKLPGLRTSPSTVTR